MAVKDTNHRITVTVDDDTYWRIAEYADLNGLSMSKAAACLIVDRDEQVAEVARLSSDYESAKSGLFERLDKDMQDNAKLEKGARTGYNRGWHQGAYHALRYLKDYMVGWYGVTDSDAASL